MILGPQELASWNKTKDSKTVSGRKLFHLFYKIYSQIMCIKQVLFLQYLFFCM